MLKDLVFNKLYKECRHSKTLSYSLQNRLKNFTIVQRKEIVSREKNGYTPLFRACEKGSFKIVKFLVEKCDADIEQRGLFCESYVTPLWCASKSGHLKIVKYLVEHGAIINSVSNYNGYSPVMIACLYSNEKIVTYLVENNADILTPNDDGCTCLMESITCESLCEFLIKHGANINAQNIYLNTALHKAIMIKAYGSMQVLLNYGSDSSIKNQYGSDVLEIACLYRDKYAFECLIEKYDYTRQRIAESYELLGCAFLDYNKKENYCLDYWREALFIRYEDNIPKKNIIIPHLSDMFEFTTFEEIDNLLWFNTHIQALFIYYRILGPKHYKTIDLIIKIATFYRYEQQRFLNLLIYGVDLNIQGYGLLNDEVYISAQLLVRTFMDIHSSNTQIEFNHIYESIRLIGNQFESLINLLNNKPTCKWQQNNFGKILIVLLHFIYLLYKTEKSKEQVIMMKNKIRDILHLEPRNSLGNTLLHLAVTKSKTLNEIIKINFSYNIFPNAFIVELLLECGANVDAINCNLDTPLGIAAYISNASPEIINILLKYGAHIDRRNGDSPHLLLPSKYNINHLQYTTLKCLAARKIMDNQIPFIGKIPVILEDFTKIH